jgi:hypothetical protein
VIFSDVTWDRIGQDKNTGEQQKYGEHFSQKSVYFSYTGTESPTRTKMQQKGNFDNIEVTM